MLGPLGPALFACGVSALGAWGIGRFENYDAADWIADVEERGAAAIDATLRSVVTLDYVERPDGSGAVAAAYLVASVSDGEIDGVPDDVRSLLTRIGPDIKASDRYRKQALAAIDRVLGPHSELAELWATTPDAEAWKRAVLSVRERLTAGSGDQGRP